LAVSFVVILLLAVMIMSCGVETWAGCLWPADGPHLAGVLTS